MLGNLTSEQLEAYAIHRAILDLTKSIDSQTFDYDPEPNATPQYDTFGRQTNRPLERLTLAAQLKRTELVQNAIEYIPGYTPPTSFRPVHKTVEKVFLPVEQYPHLNFVGLLLGPRGRTLQQMEKESQARISIRGRGSSKTDTHNPEGLHVIIASDNQRALEKARKLVDEVIHSAVELPENENSHKREQLRELASLNGTLRDDACSLCGDRGHFRSECPSHVSKFTCRACGEEGHFARDCLVKSTSPGERERSDKRNANDIFDNIMKEVNEKRMRRGSDANVSAAPVASAPPGIDAPPGVAQPPGMESAMSAPPGISTDILPPPPPPGPVLPPAPPSFASPPSSAPPAPPLNSLPPPPPPAGPAPETPAPEAHSA